MLRIFKNRKGQSTAEYAILIGLIVAVGLAMQTYVKRGLQGRVKDAVDKIATDTSTLGSTQQYEPYYLESLYETTTDRKQREEYLTGGAVTRTIESDDEKTTRAAGGYQKIKATVVEE